MTTAPTGEARASTRRSARRSQRTVSLLVVATLVAALLGLSSPIEEAGAQSSTRVVEVTGRGWGHGRGLGQYGARGYAEAGWSSSRILDHYYGGTTAGSAPAGGPVNPEVIRVELRYMRGQTTAVALGQGTIVVKSMNHVDLATVTSGAARLRWTGGQFVLETATSCGGPWTAQPAALGGDTTLRLAAQTGASGLDGLLAVCGPTGRTWYQGEIRAVSHNGAARTVNTLSVEQYLRGVVPNEMPASWPAPALEAQSVAARSYALAGDGRQQPYADTCDTILCQVYDGMFTERGGFRPATRPTTDAAIAATAGLVRLTAGGQVARTEFSSSTGGHTTGGTFPAVVDEGDAIAANPNHTWSTTVQASTFEDRYNRGRLLEARVTARNGLGADGGRAVQVELRFERGTVTEPAGTVRSFLGLKSDWFSFGPVVDTSLRSTPEGRYIDRTFVTLAGRGASDGEITDWHATIRGGDRQALTRRLVTSEHFAGRMVDDLYQRALGRAPDPAGRTYWIQQLAAGTKLEAVGVLFYGSTEYHLRSGGTNASFVEALYRDVLGRAPDAGGRAYWEDRLSGGTARLDDVASGFYISFESRRVRAAAVHNGILGPIPDQAVGDALANRLLAMSDLMLAAEIAASQEAYQG